MVSILRERSTPPWGNVDIRLKAQILTGSIPSKKAFAKLIFSIATVIFVAHLWMKGTNHQGPNDLVRRVMQIATNKKLVLLCSFASVTYGARAEDLNDWDFQSWSTQVDANVDERLEYARAAAVALLVVIFIALALARTRRGPGGPGGQCHNDFIDRALERSPVPTRSNSPLTMFPPLN